jgi:transcriptional regulator with XRE-family HTH domain
MYSFCSTSSGSKVGLTMSPRDRIRDARISAGLSQTELAVRAGCHQSDISDLERQWEGSPRFRQRVAATLGVELTAAEVVAEPPR